MDKNKKFAFKRKQTIAMAKQFVILESRFNKELNNIILPCGEKIKLASSISRYEKVRLMMQIKGFGDFIPVKNCEYVARMINAYQKRKSHEVARRGNFLYNKV
jgi:hypothetical protein